MNENDFKIINTARKTLELNEISTIEEIKQAYRNKIKDYHPDKNKNDNDGHWKTMEIINAYEILVKYCQNYKFSFKKEDFLKQSPISFDKTSDAEYTSWWQNHYGNDPLWGKEHV